MVCPQLSDPFARKRLGDEAGHHPRSHQTRQGHLSHLWQGWTWYSHPWPNATRCLRQRKVRCHLQIPKKHPQILWQAEKKPQNMLSSLINLENYSARVAANYDLMWSEKRMCEIQELAGTVTISFSAVSPTQRRRNERGENHPKGKKNVEMEKGLRWD